MGWTKRQIASESFRELGLADYDYDIDPDEEQTALRRLNAMMGTFEARGIQCGYNFPGGLDDDSGLSDQAVETIYLHLAIRMGPAFGKSLQPQVMKNAEEGYQALLFAAAAPQQMQQPRTLPRGQGTKPWRTNRPYNFPNTTDPVEITPGFDMDIT